MKPLAFVLLVSSIAVLPGQVAEQKEGRAKTVVLFNKFRANTRSGRKDLDERTKQVTGNLTVRFDFVIPFREFFSALHAIPWPGNGEAKIPLLKLLNRVLGRDGRDAYYAAIQLAGGITHQYLRIYGKTGQT